jgi:predicted RNA-binding protein associated with RNAse of E/G family
MHPPKREVFDVPAMTNTDNKGFVRPVEVYRETPYGLYMSRTADHPRFDHLELWLLPALGLRANIFHFTGGYRSRQRLYLDIGEFSGPDDAGRWHSVDWYLDLVDSADAPLELVDVDELFDAHAAGHLTTSQCEAAILIAMRTMTGSAAVDGVQTWLDAQVGERLTWLDRPQAGMPDSGI